MPSLNTKNVELDTCLAPCKPIEEVSCGVVDSPLSDGKAEIILRLFVDGKDIDEIVRMTAPCGLPDPEAREFSIDGSPTPEYRKRRVLERYTEHVKELIEQASN